VTDPAPPSGTSFIADLGFNHRSAGDGVVGEMAVTPHILVPGTRYLRVSVAATVADVLTGVLASGATRPRIALTADLTVHTLSATTGSSITMAARLLKAGRTLLVGDCWFTVEGHEQPMALSEVSFMASPRPQDVIVTPTLDRDWMTGALEEPFHEQLGARVVSPGVVEMDRDPYVLQPAGTIQGGAMALLAELAAETLTHRAVVGLQIRYLSTVRIGPARTSAHPMSPDAVRVELRDSGNDRLAAVAVAYLAPAC
jgi:acyl-coenzyme A thioesterase PaaI-like protein